MWCSDARHIGQPDIAHHYLVGEDAARLAGVSPLPAKDVLEQIAARAAAALVAGAGNPQHRHDTPHDSLETAERELLPESEQIVRQALHVLSGGLV